MIITNKTDLKKIRKDIKKIGFNYRRKNYSDFSFLEFYHIETKKVYPDIFTKKELIFWSDLIKYLEQIKKEIK